MNTHNLFNMFPCLPSNDKSDVGLRRIVNGSKLHLVCFFLRVTTANLSNIFGGQCSTCMLFTTRSRLRMQPRPVFVAASKAFWVQSRPTQNSTGDALRVKSHSVPITTSSTSFCSHVCRITCVCPQPQVTAALVMHTAHFIGSDAIVSPAIAPVACVQNKFARCRPGSCSQEPRELVGFGLAGTDLDSAVPIGVNAVRCEPAGRGSYGAGVESSERPNLVSLTAPSVVAGRCAKARRDTIGSISNVASKRFAAQFTLEPQWGAKTGRLTTHLVPPVRGAIPPGVPTPRGLSRAPILPCWGHA